MLAIELWPTALILLVSVATITSMGWLERRNRKQFRTTLVPTIPITLLAGVAFLLSLVHLLNLLGVHTGR